LNKGIETKVALNNIFFSFASFEPDLIFIWRWKNNIHNSCERVHRRSVLADAYNARIYQESALEFIFVNQINWNHCNSIGLFSNLPSVYIAKSSYFCPMAKLVVKISVYESSYISFNFKGSRWWAEMGPLLHKWWLCGYGFTQWNGHTESMQ